MASIVCVGKSSIFGAGNGIFANRPFAKGERVCFYDGILCNKNEVSDEDFVYAMARGDQVLVGYKDPVHPLGVAQLANDAGRIFLDGVRDVDSLQKRCLQLCKSIKFYAASSYKNNIGPQGGETNDFIALRNIQKGEELFFGYGLSYWFDILWRDAKIRKNEGQLQAIGLINGHWSQVNYICSPEQARLFFDLFRDQSLPEGVEEEAIAYVKQCLNDQ